MKPTVNEGLHPLIRPIHFFKPDPKNARAHPRRSIDAIKRSLSDFGQQKPVVALRSGVLVAGTGTLQAALELKWEGLAVVIFENEKSAKAYAIADNRTAELSVWDIEVLAPTIREIGGMYDVGFTPEEIADLTREVNFDAGTEEEQGNLDEKSKRAVECPKCGHEFKV